MNTLTKSNLKIKKKSTVKQRRYNSEAKRNMVLQFDDDDR